MATVPLATGARLLGIHPKTLRHWLNLAHLPLAAHPTDARSRCVAEADLLEVARRHSRPLPPLSAVPALESYAASGLAEEQAKPRPAHEAAPAQCAASLSAPCASLADLLQQLGHLHTQVATLQQQFTGLALHVLHERTEGYDQRLRSLAALLSAPLEAVQPSQPMEVAAPLAPCPPSAPRLLPVEVRARSRVSALIEYGAQGQYVAVGPRQGVLALVPDSPAWFDWLARLSSFRGCRDQPGAFRRVGPQRKGSTPAAGRPGACFMDMTSGAIWGSRTA